MFRFLSESSFFDSYLAIWNKLKREQVLKGQRINMALGTLLWNSFWRRSHIQNDTKFDRTFMSKMKKTVDVLEWKPAFDDTFEKLFKRVNKQLVVIFFVEFAL